MNFVITVIFGMVEADESFLLVINSINDMLVLLNFILQTYAYASSSNNFMDNTRSIQRTQTPLTFVFDV